ncbi:platelet glycoprotein 4-like [Tubulanus polymorphus]|uniref:platelet glycoprotein 4-like n=1 Tax=Tubulanus polymorphus TaxID=672921 RepID=UPI003DA24A0B
MSKKMVLSVLAKAVVVVIVGIALIAFGVILFPVIPAVIRSGMDKDIPFAEGSEAVKTWEYPPVPVYMNFYVFDLLNKDETMAGAKPSVLEKGPYVYRQLISKANVTFNPNSTVSYTQPVTYVFVPELSGGKENDTFTALNMVLATVADLYQKTFEKLGPAARLLLEEFLKLAGENMFRTLTVKDMIWGYEDPFLKKIAPLMKAIGVDVPETIGIFIGQNGSDDGVHNIYTGVKDIMKFNTLDRYNGQSELSFWRTPYCNRIQGSTDGTMWHPFIDESETLYIFNSGVCRSFYIKFDSRVQLKGVDLLRFVQPASVYANATINPDNIGFCMPDDGHCLDSGVLNVSHCRQGAPVFMSEPHFYNAASKYIDAIIGIHPNKENHATRIDVEPYTGVGMSAKMKFQINIYYENYKGIDSMKNLRPTFYPLAWFEASATLTDALASKMRNELVLPLTIGFWVKICMICIGFVITTIGIIYGYKRKVWCRGKPSEETLVINEKKAKHNYGSSEETQVTPAV